MEGSSLRIFVCLFCFVFHIKTQAYSSHSTQQKLANFCSVKKSVTPHTGYEVFLNRVIYKWDREHCETLRREAKRKPWGPTKPWRKRINECVLNKAEIPGRRMRLRERARITRRVAQIREENVWEPGKIQNDQSRARSTQDIPSQAPAAEKPVPERHLGFNSVNTASRQTRPSWELQPAPEAGTCSLWCF